MTDTVNDAISNRWMITMGVNDIGDFRLLTTRTQGFEIPGLSTGLVEVGRNRSRLNLNAGGDSLTQDPMSFTFVVDENWENYRLCRKWLKTNAGKQLPIKSDLNVQLLDAAGKAISSVEFTATDAMPTDLSAVSMDIESNALVCTITFTYTEGLFGDETSE